MKEIDPADIEQDVLESLSITDSIHELLAEITGKLDTLKLDTFTQGTRSESHCKLPKLELPTFKGDSLKWQGFWDQFEVTINNNETLNDIDRFSYLRRYLSGQALATISGLSLSKNNYTQAINLLKERYGNPQVLITAHMESLFKGKEGKNNG